jgi:hypothetical protein
MMSAITLRAVTVIVFAAIQATIGLTRLCRKRHRGGDWRWIASWHRNGGDRSGGRCVRGNGTLTRCKALGAVARVVRTAVEATATDAITRHGALWREGSRRSGGSRCRNHQRTAAVEGMAHQAVATVRRHAGQATLAKARLRDRGVRQMRRLGRHDAVAIGAVARVLRQAWVAARGAAR